MTNLEKTKRIDRKGEQKLPNAIIWCPLTWMQKPWTTTRTTKATRPRRTPPRYLPRMCLPRDALVAACVHASDGYTCTHGSSWIGRHAPTAAARGQRPHTGASGGRTTGMRAGFRSRRGCLRRSSGWGAGCSRRRRGASPLSFQRLALLVVSYKGFLSNIITLVDMCFTSATKQCFSRFAWLT